MVARTCGARWRRLVMVVIWMSGALAGSQAPAQLLGEAQCVGDCNGDGMVVINELIIGVNIAQDLQPVSACPAFANARGQVDIAQLIKGVNNALYGCPATPTATASATRTATASVTRTATARPTATGVPTGTATATASPTATGVPTGTATATVIPTPTGVPTGTATATEIPTPTGVPTGTATATEIPIPTGVPTGTATATFIPTATGVPTGTATATATGTPAGTASATLPLTTPTPTATAAPTGGGVPPGEAVAGRAAIVSTGLGSVQALVGAIVATVNAGGTSGAVGASSADGGGVAAVSSCPQGGTVSRDCTGPSGGPLALTLDPTNCIVAGPMGGTAEFDGSIGVNANAGPFVSCSPTIFFAGSFAFDSVDVQYRDQKGNPTLDVGADLSGTFALTPALNVCPVSKLDLVLSGTLASSLPDGSSVAVQFDNTSVTIDQIVFSADCLPTKYRLTFNGPATFTPTAASAPGGSGPVMTAALAPAIDSFAVTFSAFRLIEDATADPVVVTMAGAMASDCFGGTMTVSTFVPLAIAAGQVCPAAGVLDATGDGTSARVTYDLGTVTVDPSDGPPQPYGSCLDSALLTCSG